LSVITAIEPQKRRGNRRSIYVNGEFVAGAHEEVILALNLTVGQTFNTDRLVEIVRAETMRKARESALRLISYRDRSVSEIRKRLLGNDFPEDIVDEVVDYMSQAGLLDDGKFSRDWVTSRTASRPMGRTRLAWELTGRGVDASTVEQALSGLDENAEYSLALSLAEKKIGKSDRGDPSLKNRMASFLRRRGFDWDVIKRVLDDLLGSDRIGE